VTSGLSCWYAARHSISRDVSAALSAARSSDNTSDKEDDEAEGEDEEEEEEEEEEGRSEGGSKEGELSRQERKGKMNWLRPSSIPTVLKPFSSTATLLGNCPCTCVSDCTRDGPTPVTPVRCVGCTTDPATTTAETADQKGKSQRKGRSQRQRK